YSTIGAEVDEAGGPAPSVVVVQMGVGALAAAVVRQWAHTAAVVVVEPESADCGLQSARSGHLVTVPGPHRSIMAGLNCGRVSPVAWPEILAGTDVFLTVSDADAERAMRDLDAAGVVAGESGASGLAGLRALLEHRDNPIDPSAAHALVINTEGA